MPIEAVIWDFGGVITSSPFEAFNRYEAANGLPVDFIRTINATNPHDNAWALYERNEVDAAGFDQLFLEESTARGYPVPGRDVLANFKTGVRPRMVAALQSCKARFKVGCITNNFVSEDGNPHRMASSEQVGEIMLLFDSVIESSKAGLRKPDPKIYLMMCELLGVAPEACVYLDDLGVNCKPAAQLGMKAIKVVSEQQALDDLAGLTGIEIAAELSA
jgi:putative hydrolase of the HAD superfamily